MNVRNDASITINRDANIVLAKQSDYIVVSKADWDRLKKKVDCCKSQTNWWMNVAFTLFGVGGSACLSYLTLPLDNNSAWVTPTLICICVSAIIIGIICIIAHYQREHIITSNINDIKEVVKDVENSLIPNDN